MNYHRPTEIIGNSINKWDEFYQNHFEWVYKETLKICRNTLKAKEITDKLFVKAFFSNPECVAEGNKEAFKNEIAVLFPYLGVMVDLKKELSAGRLLHLYYQPN